ncbi:MAG: hypothetical protein V3S00_05705 [Dehalococcoidia bacterium]
MEEAAEIAGYSIAVPGFLPADFVQTDTIMVNQKSFGEAAWKHVTQIWNWQGDPSVRFSLEQSPKPFTLGGETEPIDINGVPGTRAALEAQPPGRPHPMLILSWTHGDFTYLLNAILGEPLTEEMVLRIAASVEAQ